MSVVIVDHDGGTRFCNYTDPAIKLFGRDIPLAQDASEESQIVSNVQEQDDQLDRMPDAKDSKEPMDIVSCKQESSACVEAGSKAMGSSSVKLGESQVVSGIAIHSTLPKVEEAQGPLVEKMPKKPDKVLPCPRCHSLDTKFCYFNNYNVNQPRHFCRKCQRYWTAGGTLRNVPVGAGRRKNKHSASYQKHVSVSDAIPIRTGTADMARHHRFPGTNVTSATTQSNLPKPSLHVLPLEAQPVSALDSPSANSSMLNFGQESPLCRSMAAATLGIQENGPVQNHGGLNLDGSVAPEVFALGGKHILEPDACTSSLKMLPPSCHTSGSPSTAAVTVGMQVQEGELMVNGGNGSHEMQAGEVAPAIHGATWQAGNNIVPKVPFNPTTATSLDSESNSSTALSSTTGLLPSRDVLACNGSLGGFWPGFTWPYMNPSLWGAPPLEWAGGPWSMPVYPPGVAAAAAAAAALLPYSGAGIAAQKHQLPERSQPEKCLWVPKTLRVDDPLNAARSSIWSTLGLGDGPLSSPVHGSAKTCQTKLDFKDDNEAVSSSRFSNPAALSRSAAFHESS